MKLENKKRWRNRLDLWKAIGGVGTAAITLFTLVLNSSIRKDEDALREKREQEKQERMAKKREEREIERAQRVESKNWKESGHIRKEDRL